MVFHAKKIAFLSIFAILATSSAASPEDHTFASGLEYFSQNIIHEVVNANSHKNIIISPFSTHTCLAMLHMGADGETAAEIDHALGFSGQSTELIADNYYNLLSRYENSTMLHLANKVYVMKGSELQNSYNDILSKNFFSSAESIDFGKNVEAASTINDWIEAKTNHLLKNVVSPSMFDSSTALALLNTIYFKGEWLSPFDEEATFESDFYSDESNTVKVQMMRNIDYFMYGRFPELNAEVVRLPYKNSDLSMLIFLPSIRTGLGDMMNQLKNTTLTSLNQKMHQRRIKVHLPKFKSEFEIELKETLEKLGMRHMFNGANLGKMLKSSESLQVSKVIHKAVIDVTERGTEAAAVTVLKAMPMSMPPRFLADHPFYYCIVNAENIVLFQGNVVNF